MDWEEIGPYRIVRVLGRGGMGVVFEALHKTIGRRAAIKVLHPDLTSSAEYVQRFLNEACAVNSIRHPGIVDIYDMGTLPEGTAYLIMEFIEGETLTQRLHRAGGALPVEDVYWIGREIALAVAAAHKQGVIHRDLKPDNIMVAGDPDTVRGERVKLFDFGIAKVRPGHGLAKSDTVFGTVMGTLWYMSPEQLKNTADVDDRADVYSLGALLFHLVTGHPPFRANSEAELIALHLMQAPAQLQAVAPHVQERLGQLIDSMLLKLPDGRPRMREVASQLAVLSGDTLAVRLPISGVLTEPPPSSFRSDATSESSASNIDPLSAPVSAKQPPSAPHSSSTMSGAASEVEQPRGGSVKRHRALIPIGAAVLLVLTIVILVNRSAPPLAPKDVASTTGAPPSTSTPAVPSLEPNPPASPAQPSVKPASPSPVDTAPKTSTPALPLSTVAGSQRKPVQASCIQDPLHTLSSTQKKSILSAAQSIQLELRVGQLMRILPNSNVIEPRGLISKNDAVRFLETLRGSMTQKQQTIPSEVKLKCGR